MNMDEQNLIKEKMKKRDGFRDEQYFIIPAESFTDYVTHPMIKSLYLTDVGFFPKALNHYREREEGIEEYILIYCTDGEGVIEVENRSYRIGPEEVFCIPRNKRHKYYADRKNPWSIFWLHLKGEHTEYFPLEACQSVGMTSKPANNRLMFLFELLFRVLERNYTLGNFIYISQVLSLILSEVYFREKVDETSTQNRHITTIIRYMYKHVAGHLTLDDIAEEFQLSKSYINIIFKTHTKQAPIEFFIGLKMQEACKLLKSTGMFVKEVSAELGYDDPYYFSRIFKKVVGISPKTYKSADYIHYNSDVK